MNCLVGGFIRLCGNLDTTNVTLNFCWSKRTKVRRPKKKTPPKFGKLQAKSLEVTFAMTAPSLKPVGKMTVSRDTQAQRPEDEVTGSQSSTVPEHVGLKRTRAKGVLSKSSKQIFGMFGLVLLFSCVTVLGF